MAEFHVTQLERRIAVPLDDPDPPHPGWVQVDAHEAYYTETTLTTDVDDVPLGVTSERWIVHTTRWLPPDSVRLERLAFEAANNEKEEDHDR